MEFYQTSFSQIANFPSIQVVSSGLTQISLKQCLKFESCEWKKICDERALLLLDQQ